MFEGACRTTHHDQFMRRYRLMLNGLNSNSYFRCRCSLKTGHINLKPSLTEGLELTMNTFSTRSKASFIPSIMLFSSSWRKNCFNLFPFGFFAFTVISWRDLRRGVSARISKEQALSYLAKLEACSLKAGGTWVGS